MPKHILITGGTGMIGSRLTGMLQEKGYTVAHISRSRTGREKVKTYTWQITKNEIEPEAIQNAQAIVHLAGANLSSKRWTESRKEVLVKSRTETANLLFQKLKQINHQVKCFVSASGANYYGEDTGDQLMTEVMPPGKDFIGDLCVKWEETARQINKLNIRTVQLRTGAVLSRTGGFLGPILPLAKAGLGSPIGSGEQYISWIHIDDICRMYIKAIEDERMSGVFNAAAPQPERNKDFMKKLTKRLHRPILAPNAPAFAVKLVFGELAGIVLGGVKVSSKKIEETGFKFKYPALEDALGELFGRR